MPSTKEEEEMVSYLSKITDILKGMYVDNNKYLKIVNAAIYSKTYTDESILLKNLIFLDDKNILTKNNRFKNIIAKLNVNPEDFSNKFWKEVEKLKDDVFTNFLMSLNGNISTSKMSVNSLNAPMNLANGSDAPQLSIYYPYSEQFMPVAGGDPNYYAPITTLVTATLDADEGWGTVPHYFNGVFQEYIQVLVNDDYAYNNPTQIIGVNGIEPYDNTAEVLIAPLPPPPPPGVSRVYVGEAICKKQFDKLISFTGNGGGSEIRFCRGSGYLQLVNNRVENFGDEFQSDFSRKQIRKEDWKRIYSIWDANWIEGNVEQIFAIYEKDNIGTANFNGSLSTTIRLTTGINTTGTIGYSFTVTTQDEIIRQLKIDRNSYFRGAFIDQGCGFRPDFTFLPKPDTHGWPIYDCGANVSYTWPYNTF